MNWHGLTRWSTATCVALGFVVGKACSAPPEANTVPKPNIVYILADDLGYGDLSCLNRNSKIPTPNMDRLGREGMIFTDAHSPSSVCTPTRYGVLTGRYCWRTRLQSSVLLGYDRPLIEPGRMTVASLLKRHGYQTAAIGKWHLGPGWQLQEGRPALARDGLEEDPGIDYTKPIQGGPLAVGFDRFFGISASLDMAPYCYLENDRVVEFPSERTEGGRFPVNWRPGPKSPGFRHADVLPELARHAVALIESQAKASPPKPFFLYFALTAPHTPVLPTPSFQGKSQAGIYGDFVCQVDAVVGQVLEALDRNHLAQNTLVILTSDNGSTMTNQRFFKPYGHDTNYHFRGQKSDAWEGGHRVPFLARWPGKVRAGSVCHDTICLTDLLATCAALVGEKLPADAGEDSYNILPDLLGTAQSPLREATVLHSIHGHFAIRQGPWKLILCRGSGGWSLPENKVPADAPDGQLYHLGNDIREQNNLYRQRPDLVARLTELLRKYQREGRSRPVD